ncbi:MAG: hypothetical protein R6V85_08435 [Polyangia bacterium]
MQSSVFVLLLAVVAGAPAVHADDDAGKSSPREEQEQAGEPQRPHETAFWLATGTAGLALISGGVFGLTALSEKRRFETNPSSQAKRRGEARALAADVSFGIAAAASVAALVLYLTDDGGESGPADDEPPPSPELSLAPGGLTFSF